MHEKAQNRKTLRKKSLRKAENKSLVKNELVQIDQNAKDVSSVYTRI